MTPEVSKQIANLFGQVAVSELPESTGSLLTGQYVLYRNDTDDLAYRINATDFYFYLCRQVFMFLAEKVNNTVEIHPESYLKTDQLTFARNLCANSKSKNWIGAPKPANNGTNISQRWFEHFQYYYFDNLNNRLPTMLLKYMPQSVQQDTVDEDRKWANDMWHTHLNEIIDATLPVVVTKTGEYKKLCVAETAVHPDESAKTNHVFNKRNYVRIVTGGWSKGNSYDKIWTDERNQDAEQYGKVEAIDQTMGDIDQTIKVISEFLADVEDSIKPVMHRGKVIFTASTETNPLNVGWTNVLGSNKDSCFVLCGTSSLSGENDTLVPGIPKHHHNTVLKTTVGALPICNVSIVGRPEGETVGGIAKVPTAERIMAGSSGKAADTDQDMVNTTPVLSNKTGAYCGTVEYTPYEVAATQKTHNNMPLYYKMRAFVYG